MRCPVWPPRSVLARRTAQTPAALERRLRLRLQSQRCWFISIQLASCRQTQTPCCAALNGPSLVDRWSLLPQHTPRHPPPAPTPPAASPGRESIRSPRSDSARPRAATAAQSPTAGNSTRRPSARSLAHSADRLHQPRPPRSLWPSATSERAFRAAGCNPSGFTGQRERKNCSLRRRRPTVIHRRDGHETSTRKAFAPAPTSTPVLEQQRPAIMASMDDGFDATAGMDMHTSPLWDTTGADMAMFDTAADTTDSFFDASQYLNIDGFGDSPAAPLGQFGESSADFKISSGVSPAPPSQSMLHPRSAASSSSPDSSSHDSSSDSSSGNKKRKTSSESSPTAISDAVYMRSGQTWQKKEPRKGDTHKYRDSVMAGTTTSTLADQEIESINKSMAGPFPNFGSTASSPGFFGNSMHDQASPNQISQNSTMMDSVPSVSTLICNHDLEATTNIICPADYHRPPRRHILVWFARTVSILRRRHTQQ